MAQEEACAAVEVSQGRPRQEAPGPVGVHAFPVWVEHRLRACRHPVQPC